MSSIVQPQSFGGAREDPWSPWAFVAFCMGATAMFAILMLSIFLYRQHHEHRYLTQEQGKRLVAITLVQARQLHEYRALLLALADQQRITGDSVQALIDSQLSQLHSLRLLARRQGVLTVK